MYSYSVYCGLNVTRFRYFKASVYTTCIHGHWGIGTLKKNSVHKSWCLQYCKRCRRGLNERNHGCFLFWWFHCLPDRTQGLWRVGDVGSRQGLGLNCQCTISAVPFFCQCSVSAFPFFELVMPSGSIPYESWMSFLWSCCHHHLEYGTLAALLQYIETKHAMNAGWHWY